MPDLYPLLVRPEFHRRVWGSRNLAPLYAQEITGEPIGEAWLTGDKCTIANGPFADRTLSDLTVKYGAELLGEAVIDASRFPLLMKFLFPQDRLSVQVHPDDATAASAGEPCGKTECWYVLRADPGAQIGLGVKPGTTRGEMERAIREIRMEHLLNWISIRPGEMFYVDAGTIHAIGPGSVIVETQQNSDTTYRLYDYGRPRPLHVKEGLRAAKERTHAGKVRQSLVDSQNGKTQLNLITSPCFVVDKFMLNRTWQFQRPRQGRRSVWCLMPLGGCGVVESEGAAPFTFSPGEAVVVPATVQSFTLKPQWEIEFLCASLPVEQVSQPATVLVESAMGRAEQACEIL